MILSLLVSPTKFWFLLLANFQIQLQTKFQHHTAVNTHFIKPLSSMINNNNFHIPLKTMVQLVKQ